MNLLAKKLGPILILALLFSCEEANEIGLNIDPDLQRIEIVYTELPVELANVQFDSISTARTEKFLMGRNVSTDLGETIVTTYTEVKPRNLDLGIPDGATFDSLTLAISGTYYYGNGFNQPQHIGVHQLSKGLIDTLNATTFYQYYSFNEAAYEVDPVGAFDFVISSDNVDTLTYRTRLSDQFGQRLFNEAIDPNSPAFDNGVEFDKFFKGLAFVPDPGNTMVFAANTADPKTTMSLYYSSPGDTAVTVSNFSFDSFVSGNFTGNTHFYNINSNRAGTPSDIVTEKFTEFPAVDNKVFLQAGVALFPKVKLDALRDFIKENRVIINQIDLVIETVEQYENGLDPPTFILYYITDDDNKFILTTTSTGATAARAIQVPNATAPFGAGNELFVPFQISNPEHYEGNITPYTQIGLVGEILPELEDFLLVPTGFTTTVNQIVIDQSKIKLRIFYTPVDSN